MKVKAQHTAATLGDGQETCLWMHVDVYSDRGPGPADQSGCGGEAGRGPADRHTGTELWPQPRGGDSEWTRS